MRYREFQAPTGLEPSVACLWQQDAVDAGELRVVPDGCVDLLWFGDHLIVAGADTGPLVWKSVPPIVGVRLRPGVAGGVLGVPASEVRDQMVPLGEFWPEAHRLTGFPLHQSEQLRALTQLVLRHRSAPDPLTAAAAHMLAEADTRVGTVADDLGVSERQLHRRMSDAVGYGPKTLARVMRLRRLVGTTAGSLADRAHASGYASQSHMSDEVRRLTGLTPVRFLEDPRITAA
ncbi:MULTISPECIES: helix-turn-helix transcriptional regulator [Nocardioides]|uniref:Helix-turn-helix domain-containing protein n=1 Tax=Nocardioides vastitatis TaxID=2568655 RepID=A0ABW0ZNZ5_9ACTN|nr:helix-turn-helix transcriptional regulator [Nocardioides sp.]THJ08456.1 helix-turn-helix transcriptional regulator [Nocardioides sp.]